MTDIFEMLLDGISTSYELLDRIPIVSGVSVLDFLIAIVVISCQNHVFPPLYFY